MFECMNHECVDSDKRCDGHRDCSDGTDEYDCGMFIVCSIMALVFLLILIQNILRSDLEKLV